MVFDLQALSTEFASIRDMLPTEVLIGTNIFRGVKTTLGANRQVELVGEYDNIEFAIRVVKKELDDKGVDLDLVNEVLIEDVTYQVLGVELDVTGTAITIVLGDKNA